MNEIEQLINEILELHRQIEAKKKLLIKLQSEKLNYGKSHNSIRKV